jgi:hypothetical protein
MLPDVRMGTSLPSARDTDNRPISPPSLGRLNTKDTLMLQKLRTLLCFLLRGHNTHCVIEIMSEQGIVTHRHVCFQCGKITLNAAARLEVPASTNLFDMGMSIEDQSKFLN